MASAHFPAFIFPLDQVLISVFFHPHSRRLDERSDARVQEHTFPLASTQPISPVCFGALQPSVWLLRTTGADPQIWRGPYLYPCLGSMETLSQGV